MIAKLQPIAYTKNALAYCERGGEVLHTHKCFGTSDDIYKQMLYNNSLNDRCQKNSFHVKLRLAPEDKGKLSNQDWINISEIYAKKIGYDKNPYAVYIHEENTNKEHIHIVASRIKQDNLAVRDNYTNYKNMDFCRHIEEKYNLRNIKRVLEAVKNNETFSRDDERLNSLEADIKSCIDQSDNFEDFEFHLNNMGIKIKKGRGITFTDKKGASFKGSAINRKFSLNGLQKMFSYKEQELRMNAVIKNKTVRKDIKTANYNVLKTRPKNLIEYVEKMNNYGIKVIPTINGQGNIKDFRFLHQETQSGLNASQLDLKINLNELFDTSNYNRSNTNHSDFKHCLTQNTLLNSLLGELGTGQQEDPAEKKNKKRRKRFKR